ncbi:MAG TPA: SNF2-related protein [Candidatus Nanoarchaeia archaeon]|nr:SNF2-related protein [Candidatus Nanoarchaeia archaeon]
MPELRPYQLEAIKEILDKKRVLIADDMGMGKCAESLVARTAIERRSGNYAKTLIVSPSSVAEHWEDEIKLWYRNKKNSKIARVQTSTYENDLRNAKNADFVIVSYPTLSYFGNGKEIERLEELRFKYGIIDEAHNAKNPSSFRSIAVKKIFDDIEYLAILSGTAIPNSVVDIYILLSLLDKKTFPITSEKSGHMLNAFYHLFLRDPEYIRRVLNDHMLRREVQDYLHQKFPELRRNNLEVVLDGDHRDAYMQVYENDDISPSSKLIQLLKASLDPNLVDPKLLSEPLRSRTGSLESNIYKQLDSLVKEVISRDGKLLIFSNLKEGVTDKLQNRYKKYGAVVIDSDVSSTQIDEDVSLREEVRRKFQFDPNTKILIATTVMDEGVDLTAATDVVHLTLPYTPAAFDQRNRRAQRIGEVKKDHVNVHTFKVRLKDSMYPVINEGIEALLEDKRRIIEYIQKEPLKITKADLEEIKNGVEKSRHLTNLIHSPIHSILNHFSQLKGQGSKKILEHYRKYPEEARIIARLYTGGWTGYYGGNTANLYTKVIRILEEKENLERKLDIASGPFSLSRKLRKPVFNVDINESMIDAGRLLEEEGNVVKGNKYSKASFHQLPFLDNSFDLAVCSLALHMSKLRAKENEFSERELALREMNRVLKNKRYGIITIPHSLISEKDFDNFHDGLAQLGFDVLKCSGFYKAGGESDFKVYFALLRKKSKPRDERLDEKLLTWHMDSEQIRKRSGTSRRRKHKFKETPIITREIVTEFYSYKSKSIEDSIREAIK